VGKPLKKTHTWSGGTGVRTRDLRNVKWRARRLATVLGDEEGKWTYIGSRGEIMIVYGVMNEEAWERVKEFRIGERAKSGHLEIALRKRRRGKEQRRKGVGDRNKTVCFYFWELMFYV
jgi:hypothetical protein